MLVRAGAAGGMLWAPCALANSLLTSQGHAAVQMRVNLAYGALLVTAVALGTQHSLLAVAVGVQVAVAVRTGLTLMALRRHLGFGPRLVLGALGQSLGLVAGAGLLGWAAHASAWALGGGLIWGLVAPAAVGLGALWALGVRAQHPLTQELAGVAQRRGVTRGR